MVRVFLINFGWFSQREFSTLAEAVAYARSTTFECSFWLGTEMLGSWSFFGGFREVK